MRRAFDAERSMLALGLRVIRGAMDMLDVLLVQPIGSRSLATYDEPLSDKAVAGGIPMFI